jgi:uncharacterized protein (TIGR02118 family)
MYKLIILVGALEDYQRFDDQWPDFLAAAEKMPGLLREVTSRVDRVIYGEQPVHLVHELHFESLKAAADAMGSPEGEAAGQILQAISGGQVTLLLADHSEDTLPNIRKFTGEPPANRA